METKDFHVLKKGSKLINRYVIDSMLGEGGFGITYKGQDMLYEVTVAIKEFYPQGIVVRNNTIDDAVTVTSTNYLDYFQQGKERFLKEAKTLVKFAGQKGIVNAMDFFEVNNTAYIVMEYLDGITLKEYLNYNGNIPIEDVLTILSPLLETLDEVHKAGIIHRDISPDNIMMMPGGEMKLMDFGAARDYTGFGGKSLSVVLKSGYAPAEQYQTRGIQGPWTDIYALSATIYRCITGQVPEDSIERVMEDHLQKPSELGIQLPPQVEKALMKGLSVSPKDRYQNLREFCNDLYADEPKKDKDTKTEEFFDIYYMTNSSNGKNKAEGKQTLEGTSGLKESDAIGKNKRGKKSVGFKVLLWIIGIIVALVIIIDLISLEDNYEEDTIYEEQTEAISEQEEQEQQYLSVESTEWTLDEHYKEFGVKDAYQNPDIDVEIENTDIIAGVDWYQSVNEKIMGKLTVGLYAKKSGTTKLIIKENTTGDTLEVNVKVNIKDNKYLAVESESIEIDDSYYFGVSTPGDIAMSLSTHTFSDSLVLKWTEDSWYDETELIVSPGELKSGDTSFFVIEDDVTKESAFVEVTIK